MLSLWHYFAFLQAFILPAPSFSSLLFPIHLLLPTYVSLLPSFLYESFVVESWSLFQDSGNFPAKSLTHPRRLQRVCPDAARTLISLMSILLIFLSLLIFFCNFSRPSYLNWYDNLIVSLFCVPFYVLSPDFKAEQLILGCMPKRLHKLRYLGDLRRLRLRSAKRLNFRMLKDFLGRRTHTVTCYDALTSIWHHILLNQS